jgi:hypothetical protein
VLLLAPLYKTSAKVIDDERKDQASHENGGSGTFVLELTQAFVTKHQLGVSEEMDKRSRDDDARSKLLQDDEDDVRLRDEVETRGKNGSEYSNGTGE